MGRHVTVMMQCRAHWDGRHSPPVTPLTEIPQGCSVEIPHPGGVGF